MSEAPMTTINLAPASKPRFYKWDKVYTSDRWYPVGNYVEHSHNRMAEFQVSVEPPHKDADRARKTEAELVKRIAALMNLSAGIPTGDLHDAVIVLGEQCL